MLARYPNSLDSYWAKVSRISSSTCDVEWLRPFAGRGGPLYACLSGRDDTQGRCGLRTCDLRSPSADELAAESAPCAEMDGYDVAEEEVGMQNPQVLHPKAVGDTSIQRCAQGPGTYLWPGTA